MATLLDAFRGEKSLLIDDSTTPDAADPGQFCETHDAEAVGVPSPTTPEVKKRGRPPSKKVDRPVNVETSISDPRTDSAVVTTEFTVTLNSPPTPVIELYINCVPSSPALPLEPYIAILTHDLAKQFEVADIRCASNDSALSFGKWRGALAAMVRAKPPATGRYMLLGDGELEEVVIEAMKPLCVSYVIGVS